jgi:hypothetical protein
MFQSLPGRIIDHRWDNAPFLREQKTRQESGSGAKTSGSNKAAPRERYGRLTLFMDAPISRSAARIPVFVLNRRAIFDGNRAYVMLT